MKAARIALAAAVVAAIAVTASFAVGSKEKAPAISYTLLDGTKQTSAEARKELEQLFAADQGEGLLGSVVREDVELPAVTSAFGLRMRFSAPLLTRPRAS